MISECHTALSSYRLFNVTWAFRSMSVNQVCTLSQRTVIDKNNERSRWVDSIVYSTRKKNIVNRIPFSPSMLNTSEDCCIYHHLFCTIDCDWLHKCEISSFFLFIYLSSQYMVNICLPKQQLASTSIRELFCFKKTMLAFNLIWNRVSILLVDLIASRWWLNFAFQRTSLFSFLFSIFRHIDMKMIDFAERTKISRIQSDGHFIFSDDIILENQSWGEFWPDNITNHLYRTEFAYRLHHQTVK